MTDHNSIQKSDEPTSMFQLLVPVLTDMFEVIEQKPGSKTAGMIKTIEDDFKTGKGDQINHILISGDILGDLVNEKLITVAGHLRNAVEEEGYLVVFPAVKIGEYTYPVKVGTPDMVQAILGNYRMATITIDGEVV